jgi:hypothetical protein
MNQQNVTDYRCELGVRTFVVPYCPRSVQHGTEKGRQSSSWNVDGLSFALGQDVGSRLGRPVEWMRLSIPFGYKSDQTLSQVKQGSELADAQSLPLDNAKLLLHLVHPGTMHGQEVIPISVRYV